jgi:hypothetical protein
MVTDMIWDFAEAIYLTIEYVHDIAIINSSSQELNTQLVVI